MKPYTSPDLEADLRGGRVIVADNTLEAAFAASEGYGAGYVERNWDDCPEGYCSKVFDMPLVSMDEAVELIKEREQKGITNRDLKKKRGIASRTQRQSSSCWGYSAGQAQRYAYADDTGEVPDISPTSIICRITGFKDEGGWCSRYIEKANEVGWNDTDEWPLNAFDRRFDTAENRAAAAKRKQVEWLDLPYRGLSKKQRALILLTVLLKVGPAATGHNWMAHAVTMVDPVIHEDRIVWYADNSGLYRDRNGVTIFDWEHGIYDDAVVPTVGRNG